MLIFDKPLGNDFGVKIGRVSSAGDCTPTLAADRRNNAYTLPKSEKFLTAEKFNTKLLLETGFYFRTLFSNNIQKIEQAKFTVF